MTTLQTNFSGLQDAHRAVSASHASRSGVQSLLRRGKAINGPLNFAGSTPFNDLEKVSAN